METVCRRILLRSQAGSVSVPGVNCGFKNLSRVFLSSVSDG